MNNKTYTYKEILLGLREEFILINEKLDKLKKCIYIADKRYYDYYFDLTQSPHDEKNPKLIIVKKDENPLSILPFLKKCKNTKNYAVMVKNSNGEYIPLKRSKHNEGDFNLVILADKKEEFNELAHEILNSDFAKKINFENYILSHQDKATPRINPEEYQYSLITDLSEFKYCGREDTLIYDGSKRFSFKTQPLTKKYFEEIMNTEFSKELFDEYHRGLIETSNTTKDFTLSTMYKPEISSEFEIQDRLYKLVLTKKEK